MTTIAGLARPRRWGVLLLTAFALAWAGLGLAHIRTYVREYVDYRGFAPPKLPHGVAGGRTVDVHFTSRALHRRGHYLVYLPPGYAPRHRRYPVLYLLHGSPGGPQVFMKIADVGTALSVGIHDHRLTPMIVVMPDGRVNGSSFSDTEWANTPTGSYAQFVVDVQRSVDHRFATIRSRRARVLAGYSEGAYGAINIGLHHPAVFGGLQSWSGYYSERAYGAFQSATPGELAANSPLDYAATLGAVIPRHPLDVFLYAGTQDLGRAQLAPMLAELRAVGAHATAQLFPGGHDWGLWRRYTPRMLRLASRFMTAAPTRASQPLSAAAQRTALLHGQAAAVTANLADAERGRRIAACQSAGTAVWTVQHGVAPGRHELYRLTRACTPARRGVDRLIRLCHVADPRAPRRCVAVAGGLPAVVLLEALR